MWGLSTHLTFHQELVNCTTFKINDCPCDIKTLERIPTLQPSEQLQGGQSAPQPTVTFPFPSTYLSQKCFQCSSLQSWL